jgi:hypothetical protein
MKSPIKLENDWHEYSKAEKVILAVVLALVVLVVISWAADGFAFNETRSIEHRSNLSQIFGYRASMITSVNHSEGEHNKI